MNKNNVLVLGMMMSMYSSICTEKKEGYKADFEKTTMKGMPGVCKHRPKNRMKRMRENRKNKEQTK